MERTVTKARDGGSHSGDPSATPEDRSWLTKLFGGRRRQNEKRPAEAADQDNGPTLEDHLKPQWGKRFGKGDTRGKSD
jgi:hypothetical protein